MTNRLLSNSKGSVFVTTMICTLLMTMVGGYTYQMTAAGSHFANQLRRSTQAQQLAEAGLASALSDINTSWSAVSGGFSSATLGEGTYQASVAAVGGRYLVESVGTVQGAQRTASAELVAPTTGALTYMFAAGGNLALDSGTGQSSGTISGDIYAGGNMTIDGPPSGGTLAITGSAYSLGTLTTSATATVSGSSNANYSNSAAFPVIDYSYYSAIAQSNALYIAGNRTYTSGQIPANPAGGVIYVTGNVVIQGTQNTTACIVADGNITIQKSGSSYPRVTVNQFSNFPALMAQGNIAFSSTGNGGAYLNTTGLVHANGNIQLSSGNHDTFSFTGAVIANGNIQTTGLTAWNQVTATYVEQTPPGTSTSGSDTMTIRSYNQ